MTPFDPTVLQPIISVLCFLSGSVCGLCFSLIAFRRLS